MFFWGRPSFWGLVYLASVPIFAFLYWLSADDFSHSQLSREVETQRTFEKASVAFEVVILQQFANSLALKGLGVLHGPTDELLGSDQINAQLRPQGIILSGTRWIGGDEQEVDGSVLPLIANTMTFSIEIRFRDPTIHNLELSQFLGDPFRIGTLTASSEGFAGFDASEALLSQEVMREGSSEVAVAENVFVGNDTAELMDQLYLAQQGQDFLAQGSFSRMLYLSAVTITTLGYGDIVPTTGWTRFLVATEAILGIIIMGLFLNSAVGQRKH
jgi:hypothetical protein